MDYILVRGTSADGMYQLKGLIVASNELHFTGENLANSCLHFLDLPLEVVGGVC